jgi:hypothetical protein
VRAGSLDMEFEPTYSFSIRKFTYDETRGELCVHYYDGRKKVCNEIPVSIVAALRDSTNPESLLQPFVVSDCVDE